MLLASLSFPTVNKMASSPSKKIALGQFYTSKEVCDFMVSLASVGKEAKVVEAGHGEGAFIEALIGAGYKNIHAYDIDPSNHKTVKKKFPYHLTAVLGDFLKETFPDPPELIIGNPPYVSWGNIDKSTKGFLLEDPFWKPLSNGQWDILYAFLIWSAHNLSNGGELIQIVPYNWFNSTYAASLRDYLASKGSFEMIAHFGEFKLFPDCYPNCIIFKWRKGENNKDFWVADFKSRKGKVADTISDLNSYWNSRSSLKDELKEGDWEIFWQKAFVPKGETWFLAPSSSLTRLKAIEKICHDQTLSDEVDVAVGVVSGLDEAYSISNKELADLNKKESSLVKQFVKAKDCSRFSIDQLTPMIFPEGIEDEAALKADYPLIYKHLLPYRERLSSRYLAKSKKWWEWATVRNLPFFERNANKGIIFVPGRDRAKLSRFSYTLTPAFGGGDVVALAPKSKSKIHPLYLLAWLTSEEVGDWWKIKGAKSGERNLYTQAYLTTIPLRSIDWDKPLEVALHDKIVEEMEMVVSGEKDEKKIRLLFKKLIG